MNSQRDKSLTELPKEVSQRTSVLFHPALSLGQVKKRVKLSSPFHPSLRSGNRAILRNFFKKNSKGFTLIEFLVVSVIITILTAAILVNYKNSGQQFALQRSAHKLAQDIRRAGEMAMSAQECCGPVRVPPGYGIWLEQGNSNYILYADTQPTSGDEFYVPADDIIETIELEKGVVIQSVNTLNKKVGINFKPPTPTIKIKFQASDEINQAIITLASGGNVKTVKVNAVGLVEVE